MVVVLVSYEFIIHFSRILVSLRPFDKAAVSSWTPAISGMGDVRLLLNKPDLMSYVIRVLVGFRPKFNADFDNIEETCSAKGYIVGRYTYIWFLSQKRAFFLGSSVYRSIYQSVTRMYLMNS